MSTTSSSTSSASPTALLHAMGQRLWLDNITRDLLDSGTLQDYIARLNITGLTSNPSIFDNAIGAGSSYDQSIRELKAAGLDGEALFLHLALDDLRRAADLFLPMHDASGAADGWVSMEISPLLARDAQASLVAAREVWRLGARDNLYVKIPGTPESLPAIEEAIFEGIPVNVTLLFSAQHYLAAAEAYLRGLERRLQAGLSPRVSSVASLFISRWDVAVRDQVPAALQNRLSIAIAGLTHASYHQLLASPRWQNLANAGALPQRLLWASTGTKDPQAPPSLYVDALAAAATINTVPENTLLAFAEQGRPGAAMPKDSADAQAMLARISDLGIDLDSLASQLQQAGAEAFVQSWRQLMDKIADKASRAD